MKSPIAHSHLTALLGKPEYDSTVTEFIQNSGKFDRIPQQETYELYELGLSLHLKNDHITLVLLHFHPSKVFRGPHQSYNGTLPNDASATDSRAEIQGKMGRRGAPARFGSEIIEEYLLGNFRWQFYFDVESNRLTAVSIRLDQNRK